MPQCAIASCAGWRVSAARTSPLITCGNHTLSSSDQPASSALRGTAPLRTTAAPATAFTLTGRYTTAGLADCSRLRTRSWV